MQVYATYFCYTIGGSGCVGATDSQVYALTLGQTGYRTTCIRCMHGFVTVQEFEFICGNRKLLNLKQTCAHHAGFPWGGMDTLWRVTSERERRELLISQQRPQPAVSDMDCIPGEG